MSSAPAFFHSITCAILSRSQYYFLPFVKGCLELIQFINNTLYSFFRVLGFAFGYLSFESINVSQKAVSFVDQAVVEFNHSVQILFLDFHHVEEACIPV